MRDKTAKKWRRAVPSFAIVRENPPKTAHTLSYHKGSGLILQATSQFFNFFFGGDCAIMITFV